MAVVRSVVVTLSANVSGFTSAMEKAAASAQAAGDSISKAVDGHEQSLNKIGNAAIGMGGVLLSGVAMATKASMDFDSAMSEVQAATHETDANMARLRDTAMRLGADTAFSATEAAAGIEELGKAGVSTDAIIGGGLKGSLDLAAAGGLSVASSAEIAATALTQFGLSGKDVPHVADLLAAGAGKAQGGVADMGMALKQGGLVASQFGLSVEETVGSLSAFASAGLIGSDAGTSFKSMLLALANPSKESAKLMKQLGLDFYDSQGKFIGVAGAAGELKKELSDLTPEQRNAALAQIFGNDAVRAANVLYNEGEQGIRQWTDAVNDQGYAAETAAARMDNLKGDIELFKGSLETAFINSGSGAQAGLRDMVQSVTGLIDKFNELSPATQEALFKAAAYGGAALVAVGGTLKLQGALAAASGAMGTLRGATGPTATSLSSGLSKSAGIATGALVGLAAVNWAGSTYQDGVDRTRISIEQMGNAALAVSKGDMGQLNQEYSNIAGTASDAGLAISMLSRTQGTAAQTVGDMVFGVLGLKTEIQQTSEMVGKFDRSLSSMKLSDAALAFNQLADASAVYGTTTEQVSAQLPAYRDELTQIATQLGVTGLSAQDMAGWMGGKIPDAVRKAAAGNKEMTATLDAMAASAGKVPKEIKIDVKMPGADETAAALMLMTDALDGLPPQVQTKILMDGAGITEQQALGLQSLLGSLPEDIRIRINQMGAEDATLATQFLMLTLQKVPAEQAVQMVAKDAGRTVQDVQGVLDRLHLVPGSVASQVSVPGAELSAQRIAEVTAEINRLPKDVQSWIKTYSDLHGVVEVQRAVAALQDRQITITTRHIEQYIYQSSGYKVAGYTSLGGLTKADGGPIDQMARGISQLSMAHLDPGVPRFMNGGPTGGGASWRNRRDDIPAFLSINEFVQPSAAVDYYGLSAMEAIRTQAIPQDFFKAFGFADGGPVAAKRIPVGTLFSASNSTTTQIAQAPAPAISRRDLAAAVRDGLQMADMVVVRRTDYSLMGGGV